jgi:L-iditol 2-dehydrogenase
MQVLMMTDFNKLELQELPLPKIQPNEALLKIKSAGICGSDLHGYTGQSGRRTPPVIMGHEATAEVVAVGEAVENVSPGGRVAIFPLEYAPAGRKLIGMDLPGAYAEYTTWPAHNLYPIPGHLSYEAGAMAEPLAVTVHAVSMAPIKPYDTAFIAGAGPIGLLTLSVLRQTGVSHIAMSDISDSRLEFAQSLGADVAINPKRQDPREAVNAFTNGAGVDIAFEAVGMSATCQQTLAVTRDGGTIIWIGNNHRNVEIDMQAIVTRELKVLGTYGMNITDFKRALAMLSKGAIPTNQLINRRAKLSEGPTLFDELLASPETIKCVFNFD